MSDTIDLNDYRSAGSRVFAGRDRGRKVREAARLDDHDKKRDVIEVRVPEDVFSINSSFFLGMFGPSIRTLGEDGFQKRYKFTGKDIGRVIRDGIDEALRTGSPLT